MLQERGSGILPPATSGGRVFIYLVAEADFPAFCGIDRPRNPIVALVYTIDRLRRAVHRENCPIGHEKKAIDRLPHAIIPLIRSIDRLRSTVHRVDCSIDRERDVIRRLRKSIVPLDRAIDRARDRMRTEKSPGARARAWIGADEQEVNAKDLPSCRGMRGNRAGVGARRREPRGQASGVLDRGRLKRRPIVAVSSSSPGAFARLAAL